MATSVSIGASGEVAVTITANTLNVTLGGGAGGLSTAQVDARVTAGVEDWAETGNTDQIPQSKLPPASQVGLTEPQVDARVVAGVADWAEDGNTDDIPASKLTNAPGGLSQAQVDARVAAGVENWAEDGNTDLIPAAKLTNAPSGGLTQDQVDARVTAGVLDWAETGNTDDIPVGKIHSDIARVADVPGAGGSLVLRSGATTWISSTGTLNVIVPREPMEGDIIAFIAPNASSGDNDATQIRFQHGGGTTTAIPLNDWDGDDLDPDVIVQGRLYTIIRLSSAARIVSVAEENTGTGGLTQTQVDARVAAGVLDWAEDGNTDLIPAAKLTNAPGGLTQTQVDARVAAGVLDWAEDGNTDLIPAAKLTNAPGGLTQAQVDARVAAGVENWAEDGNSDLIPAAKLTNAPGGLTQSQVDARVTAGVLDWAETGNTDVLPVGKIPAAIARVANVPGDGGSVLYQTGNPTINNSNARIRVPLSRMPDDGDVIVFASPDASGASGTIGIGRDQGGDIFDLHSNDGADVNASDLTTGRIFQALKRASDYVLLTDINAGGDGGGGGLTQAQVDARVQAGVSDWAETSNTDLIPDSKISSNIARDEGIPDDGGTVLHQTATTTWSATDGRLSVTLDRNPVHGDVVAFVAPDTSGQTAATAIVLRVLHDGQTAADVSLRDHNGDNLLPSDIEDGRMLVAVRLSSTFRLVEGVDELVDITDSGLPEAGEAQAGRLFIDRVRKSASFLTEDRVAQTDAVGDFTDYAESETNGPYLGPFANDTDANTHVTNADEDLNKFYWNFHTHAFRYWKKTEVTPGVFDWHWSAVTDPATWLAARESFDHSASGTEAVWLGDGATDAELRGRIPHDIADASRAYGVRTSGTIKVRKIDGSAYTAPVNASTTYEYSVLGVLGASGVTQSNLDQRITSLIGGAPAARDTLGELSTAIDGKVTNTALGAAASESTTVAPSRQAVATAIAGVGGGGDDSTVSSSGLVGTEDVTYTRTLLVTTASTARRVATVAELGEDIDP